MTERNKSEAAWKAIREELEDHGGDTNFMVNFAPIEDGSGEVFEIVDMDLLILNPDSQPSVRYLPYKEPKSASDIE